MLEQALTLMPYCFLPVMVVLYGVVALLRGSMDRVLFLAIGFLASYSVPAAVLMVWFLVAPLFANPSVSGRGLDLSGLDFPLVVIANGALGLGAVILVTGVDLSIRGSKRRRE